MEGACSAEGQGSTKAAKVVAARLALLRWSDEFDYGAASGQAYELERAEAAAAFAEAQKESTDGQGEKAVVA